SLMRCGPRTKRAHEEAAPGRYAEAKIANPLPNAFVRKHCNQCSPLRAAQTAQNYMLARKDLQDFPDRGAPSLQSSNRSGRRHFAAILGDQEFLERRPRDWHGACIYIATVEEWDGGLGQSHAGA